jgi:hypothetical protein
LCGVFASKHDLRPQGVIKVLKHQFQKRLVGGMLQLIKINPGAKNLNFRLSVLDAMHFLATSWNLISAAVIRNCFRKAFFFRSSE